MCAPRFASSMTGFACPAFRFDKTYTVTLKAGLPAASGDKLPEDETVPVELRDKPSHRAIQRRHHPAAR